MATRKIYDNNFSDTQAKKEDNDKDPDMPMTEARMGKVSIHLLSTCYPDIFPWNLSQILKISRLSPISGPTQQRVEFDCTNGWEIPGESCFPIQRHSPRFAPLKWGLLPDRTR